MTLTIALALLGGLVIAGVGAHGLWSARKAAVVKQPAGEGSSDANGAESMAIERREPAFDASLEPFDMPPITLEGRPLRRRYGQRLDALIDAIVPLQVEAPVSAELALTHLPPSRRAGTKPLLIEGLNTESAEWELPRAGERYGEFQIGVQLANRSGALNEIEYSEFVQKAQRFAESVGAMADVPDMIDVVSRARELDAFASQHDAQLAVQLRARGAAWSVGYIEQQAAKQGFAAGVVAGRLILPAADEGAPPVLILSFDPQAAMAEDPNLTAVRLLTLTFDVPQTDSAIEPFKTWQTSAFALARDFEADLVDDRGQPLPEAAFDAIGKDLGQLYTALAARDLGAGSAAARRVFS